MTKRRQLWILAATGVCCSLAGIGGNAIAQRYDTEGQQGQLPRGRLVEPVYRPGQTGPTSQPTQAVATETPTAAPARSETARADTAAGQAAGQVVPTPAVIPVEAAAAAEHPLTPVLKMAYEGLDRMDRTINDYECLMVKRERIDGKLGEHQYVHAKVRNKPFSIYMYFLAPEESKGREAIYVEGQNDGKMIAHDSGFKGRLLKRLYLDPKSPLVMANQRYPITMAGIRNLTQELVTVGEHDKQFGECDVKFFKGAKVQDRVCTCIQVMHPVPRKNFRFHLARIYIDDEYQIPIRYESYDWPQKEGGQPVLLEEYTYTKLKLNVGLKDADFDADNPNYNFQ